MSTDFTPDGLTPMQTPLKLVNDGEVYQFDTIMSSATAGRGLIKQVANHAAYALKSGVQVEPLEVTPGPTQHADSQDNVFVNLVEGGNDVKVTFSNVKVGDIVVAFCNPVFDAISGTPNSAGLRFGNSGDSIVFSGPSGEYTNTVLTGDFWSWHTIATARATQDIWLQLRPSDTDCQFDTLNILVVLVRNS